MDAEESQCPAFSAAMEVLARPWTGLLIRALGGGRLRFSELGQRVGPIGDRMLSVRLRELEGHGLVRRDVLPGPPVRVEYALTDLGRGFGEVAKAVSQWGNALLRARDERASAPPARAKAVLRKAR